MDIQGVLSVDKGGDATFFLGFCSDVQGQGCFAGRFRAVNLDDSAAGYTADTESDIKAQGAGWNGFDVR